MKKILTSIVLMILSLTIVHAEEKFNNLSEEYLTTNASLKVRKVIAKDPKTSKRVLEILTQDSNKSVRDSAKLNLK